jgi:hypothetical protein
MSIKQLESTVLKPILKRHNLLFSLPDDIIRNIYSMDSTYHSVFSNENAKYDLIQAYWARNSIRTEVVNNVLAKLESIQEDGIAFNNRFVYINREDGDDSFYIHCDTYGMSQEEINALPGGGGPTACRLTDLCVHFSSFEDVLRWVIIPTSFRAHAEEYFKRREEETGTFPLYDGMCSLKYETLEDDRYQHYTSVGRVMKLVEGNLPFFHAHSYIFNTYYDAVSVDILSQMPPIALQRVVFDSSNRRFVFWM